MRGEMHKRVTLETTSHPKYCTSGTSLSHVFFLPQIYLLRQSPLKYNLGSRFMTIKLCLYSNVKQSNSHAKQLPGVGELVMKG